MNLSVTMTTFNEEKNLPRCLDSVKGLASEIVIVDGQSTDKTAAIAKKYHAKVIVVPNNPQNFHTQKKLANDNASGDWIFQVDPDEVVTPKLAAEVKKTINSNPSQNGFWIPRANYFLAKTF